MNIDSNQRIATTCIAVTMHTLFFELRFGQDGVDHFEWGAGGGRANCRIERVRLGRWCWCSHSLVSKGTCGVKGWTGGVNAKSLHVLHRHVDEVVILEVGRVGPSLLGGSINILHRGR